MTKTQTDWWKYSNIVPMIFTVISGIVGLSAYFFFLNTQIQLLQKDIDFIKQNLTLSSNLPVENRELILDLERRVQRLEDTR